MVEDLINHEKTEVLEISTVTGKSVERWRERAGCGYCSLGGQVTPQVRSSNGCALTNKK